VGWIRFAIERAVWVVDMGGERREVGVDSLTEAVSKGGGGRGVYWRGVGIGDDGSEGRVLFWSNNDETEDR
jgi:hypothetical protein